MKIKKEVIDQLNEMLRGLQGLGISTTKPIRLELQNEQWAEIGSPFPRMRANILGHIDFWVPEEWLELE